MEVEKARQYLDRVGFDAVLKWFTGEIIVARPVDPLTYILDLLQRETSKPDYGYDPALPISFLNQTIELSKNRKKQTAQEDTERTVNQDRDSVSIDNNNDENNHTDENISSTKHGNTASSTPANTKKDNSSTNSTNSTSTNSGKLRNQLRRPILPSSTSTSSSEYLGANRNEIPLPAQRSNNPNQRKPAYAVLCKPTSNGANPDGTSMNVGNKLRDRPSTKVFTQYSSGNAMKAALALPGAHQSTPQGGPSSGNRMTSEEARERHLAKKRLKEQHTAATWEVKSSSISSI